MIADTKPNAIDTRQPQRQSPVPGPSPCGSQLVFPGAATVRERIVCQGIMLSHGRGSKIQTTQNEKGFGRVSGSMSRQPPGANAVSTPSSSGPWARDFRSQRAMIPHLGKNGRPSCLTGQSPSRISTRSYEADDVGERGGLLRLTQPCRPCRWRVHRATRDGPDVSPGTGPRHPGRRRRTLGTRRQSVCRGWLTSGQARSREH